METRVTRMFDLQAPIIGAPMFLVSGAELVAAVSEAGGLGTFPSLNGRSHQDFAALLDAVEQRTRRPYGVNLVLKDNPRLEDDLTACLARPVALLITSLGDPGPVIARARASGARVFCDVTTMRHARRAVAAGADGLIAVCAGAGGHAGTLSPLVFVPWLRDSFDVPVVLAGGVADGRGLAAALSLGAEAVYLGTRLIATPEAQAAPAYKDEVVAADAEQVEYTAEVTGVPASFLSSSLARLRRGEVGSAGRYRDVWSAGQGVALIHAQRSAREIVQTMVSEARAALARGLNAKV